MIHLELQTKLYNILNGHNHTQMSMVIDDTLLIITKFILEAVNGWFIIVLFGVQKTKGKEVVSKTET